MVDLSFGRDQLGNAPGRQVVSVGAPRFPSFGCGSGWVSCRSRTRHPGSCYGKRRFCKADIGIPRSKCIRCITRHPVKRPVCRTARRRKGAASKGVTSEPIPIIAMRLLSVRPYSGSTWPKNLSGSVSPTGLPSQCPTSCAAATCRNDPDERSNSTSSFVIRCAYERKAAAGFASLTASIQA